MNTILEPEIPIIDSHHHIWNHPGSPYLVADFLDDASGGHRIVKTVFVECLAYYRQGGPTEMKTVGETESIRRLAEENETFADHRIDVAAGIVGFADLTLGASVEAVLEAHIEAGGERFKGVRHASGWDPSDEVPNAHHRPPEGLLADSKFRKGLSQLSKHGLCFDASAYHPQLPEVADLARQFPDTVIVLNHVGVPLGIGPYADRNSDVMELWRKGIDELSPLENVYIKFGGVGMNLFGFHWQDWKGDLSYAEIARAASPFFLHCIEGFGPHRCMFESNFPVDKTAFTYTAVWNAFKSLTGDMSIEERSWLFYRTAECAYRLYDDG